MPEQSLHTIRMSRGTALAMGTALAALVEERLPLMVQTSEPAKPMRLIGPAMLARGAGTVQAIGKLAPLDREAGRRTPRAPRASRSPSRARQLPKPRSSLAKLPGKWSRRCRTVRYRPHHA